MRRWITDQLARDSVETVVVIDENGIATDLELGTLCAGPIEIHRAADWFGLRKTWELFGRRRDPEADRLVIVMSDPAVGQAEDIPYDIEQAVTVARIRVPGTPRVAKVISELDPELSDRVALRINNSATSDVDVLLTAIAGLPPTPLDLGTGSTQLRIALELALHPQPEGIGELAREVLTDPLALALIADPANFAPVQDAWSDWMLREADSPWARHFPQCGSEITGLFLNGVLSPVLASPEGMPSWVTVGLRKELPAERIEGLFGAQPVGTATSTFEDWVVVAQWWGRVRSNLAQINPVREDLSRQAWSKWETIHAEFQTWLRHNYGNQLSRSWATGPVTLDKVQHFLTTRRSLVGPVLLVILDGLGFAQWDRIVERASLRVVRGGAVMAMVPTLTTVSRQAIAAGATPSSFAESLTVTNKEPQRWASAWEGNAASPAWLRIDGRDIGELDGVPFEHSDVIGLVVSATDELMHGAELLGDLGLHASLDAWIDTNVLDTLVARAAEHGFHIWITADHGNLECIPSGSTSEGLFVESAGTRVRRYANHILRDQAMIEGDTWDDIPGLPAAESERLLFANGRTGWTKARVSHGGLSIDEIIVPFVQVEPA
jgi:hypothetical protein